jgi:hypothetical protein
LFIIVVVQFDLDSALAILCLWNLNWWNFYGVGVRLGSELVVLILVQLLNIFNFAVIGGDLQVDWYRCLLLLGKGGEEFICGASISCGLRYLFNLYFHLLSL